MLRTTGKRDAYTTGVERVALDRVSKFVGPQAAVEFQKARAVEQALVGTRFTTPKVLSYDLAAERIEFAFIDGMTSMYDSIVAAYRSQRFDAIFAQNRSAGELLATLHHNLVLPSSTRWVPTPDIAQRIRQAGIDWTAETEVCLHCDYSPVNVLLKPNGDLVVIDASPNQYFTESANLLGPPAVDIATYTAKLFWPFRARTFTSVGRNMAYRLRSDFVASYEQASGVKVNPVLLKILERGVVRGFVARKTGSRLMAAPAMALARLALPN